MAWRPTPWAADPEHVVGFLPTCASSVAADEGLSEQALEAMATREKAAAGLSPPQQVCMHAGWFDLGLNTH